MELNFIIALFRQQEALTNRNLKIGKLRHNNEFKSAKSLGLKKHNVDPESPGNFNRMNKQNRGNVALVHYDKTLQLHHQLQKTINSCSSILRLIIP